MGNARGMGVMMRMDGGEPHDVALLSADNFEQQQVETHNMTHYFTQLHHVCDGETANRGWTKLLGKVEKGSKDLRRAHDVHGTKGMNANPTA